MVLEHQTVMHNLITHANYQSRIALAIQEDLNTMEGAPSDKMRASTKKRFSYAAEPLLKYLLFAEEAPLEGPVKGTSGFTDDFQSRGVRDSEGRSLRDLDLRTRTFKHPLSFLVYSESFDNLPKPFLDYLYRRLWGILNGEEAETYSRLTPEDRRAIREILIDTKSGLPEYWNLSN